MVDKAKMEWSIFNYKIENNNKFVIKNSKTLGTIELDKTIYSRLDCCLNDSIISNKDEYISYLYNEGFIVDSNKAEVDSFISEMNALVKQIDSEFSITILPTQKCNFCCSYCYENGTDRQTDITIDRINDLFVWIENTLINKYRINRIKFLLFGGEPLCSDEECFDYLLNRIASLGIDYDVSIITNGYLLDKDKRNALSKVNLEFLQITLDGMKEYHDKYRVLTSGKGTFDTIVKNLVAAVDEDVSRNYAIRVNCNKRNIDTIPDLIEYLADVLGEKRSKVSFSFGLLGKSYNKKVNTKIDEEYLNIEDGSLKKYVLLYKMVRDYGFEYTDFYEISALCSNKVSDSLIIQSDGMIGKCLRGVGRRDFIEGSIDNIGIIERRMNSDFYHMCFDEGCPYVPFCHLGCQFGYFIDNNIKVGRFCQRELLDYINKMLLKEMY